MILSDKHIRILCRPGGNHGFWLYGDVSVHQFEGPMVEPFCEPTSGGGIISHGLSSAGYDLRLAPGVRRFRTDCGVVIDPKLFKDENYCARVFDCQEYGAGGQVVIAPGEYILASTVEYVRIPRRVVGIILGKSTLARCLSMVNCTPIEPEWKGHITLEIGNVGHLPACIYAGEGVCQLQFHVLSSGPDVSYNDKGGQYQGTTGVVAARVKP